MRHAMPFALLALAGLAVPAEAAPLKVVVFAIEAQGTSGVARDRLEAETALLRKLVAERGYTIVDTAPQAKQIAENTPLGECNGCDNDIAKALGADLEVATSLQQLSAAIYNIGGTVKDVRTDRVLRQGVANIQGNDADNWNHGVRFLVRERLFDPPLPTTQGELAATGKDAR